jgi:hypothetical protein
MYQLGKRPRHHTIIILVVVGVAVVAAGFLIAWLLHIWRSPAADIQNPTSASVEHYNPAGSEQQRIDKSIFSMDVPVGWKELPVDPTDPYQPLRFQSKEGTQRLDVYVDNIPPKLAVNRVLAVQPQGNGIGHDTVSDNCMNFLPPNTLAQPQVQASKVAEAKWQNVEFYCDVGNYERNVTGTSSPAGINMLSLSGSTAGSHQLFFTFTNNNITPQYTVLYGILDSFTLK